MVAAPPKILTRLSERDSFLARRHMELTACAPTMISLMTPHHTGKAVRSSDRDRTASSCKRRRHGRARGLGRPETFDFLALTHTSGRTREGYFTVRRITIKKRMRAKLKEVKAELRRR